MTDSVRGQIMENMAARLATVTAANGYSTNVKKVYYDQIPMGIDLPKYDLPTIFQLNRVESNAMQQKCYQGMWEFDLQLWEHGSAGDIQMAEFVRNVYKGLYANSATAEVDDQFRSIHPQLTELVPLPISSDLNMIEANRITVVTFRVHYRTKLYNL